MRPLTCIIIDDEPLAVKLLESFVTKTPGLELVASFTDSVEAIAKVKENAPNLLFLDIQMPDINGMELARMIPPETRIIFTTAFQEFALESYEVSALDFLLKPIRYNKSWYNHTETPETTPESNNNNDTIFIKVDGEFRQIAFSDILYIGGMKDYVMFYLEGERKPLITHLTMKAVEDLLPEGQFMRVHRSYIVALNKIRSVDRNDCIYIGDEIIRVTEAYREQFSNYLKSRFPG